MAYTFKPEDKEVPERTEYMPFGVNTVKIIGAMADVTPNGADYIEIGVENADGISDSARLYFTEKSSKYSVDTIRQIAVHSAKIEAHKEKARKAVDNAKDTDELAQIVAKNCLGAEAWVTKYYDPTRTYTNANNEVKPSINTNIYGYEPRLKPELMPKLEADEEIITDANVQKFFDDIEEPTPGTISDKGTVEIPESNGWDE